MMDFNNLKIANAYKTAKEKRKSLWVFRIITKPFLVWLGKFLLKTALFLHIPIKPFTKFMFNHFCGGENLSEVIELSKRLSKYNVKTIPDYSIEGKTDEESYKRLMDEVKRVIDLSSQNPNISFAVFKPTGLIDSRFLTSGIEDNHPEIKKYVQRLDELFAYAHNKGVKILVDAEDFMFQEKIDDILLKFMQTYNKESAIIFTTLQMYRRDRLDYLSFLIDFAKRENIVIGIKFVRGAYLEKERERAKHGNYPDPIYPQKVDTDNAFNKAIELSIKNLKNIEVFCGTHNEESVLRMIEFMRINNLEKNDNRLWFSQLYGMRDYITFNLADEGYNVAKYLPYGPLKEVMPYLVRRAEENSSMSSQAKKEIEMTRV